MTQELIATRKAYGNALARLMQSNPHVIALDAETSNSTFAETAKSVDPDRFIECYIAEQNMVSVATGLASRGKRPYISTFAAFFSRAFDQIRMSQYSKGTLVFVGSHAGVSIGDDGASQMALEDIAMMRSVGNTTVLYPSDSVSMNKLMDATLTHDSNIYIRSTRAATPLIYQESESFPIGGSKTVYSAPADVVTIIGAGITLHESLQAYDILKQQGISARVIDLYSIKPIDTETLMKAARETKALIVVEDHRPQGGIYEAVTSSLAPYGISTPTQSLAVTQTPRSGTPEELMKYMKIDSESIVHAVKSVL